jgi:G6PDH family F420-dependent oxidoreductase
MTKFGYFLATEEFGPAELLERAQLAEQAGFDALWISDHFHPWTDSQGQSAFVWSVIGALSQKVRLPITTAVTCPTVRIHPVIIAQAAATSAVLTEGRFVLGVGTGEALNEHVVGQRWPNAEQRLDMLAEAVDVLRQLWSGDVVSHQGRYYTVDTARIYTTPTEPPKIYLSGFGPKATRLAAEIADGYINTDPDKDAVTLFRESGGGDKPVQGGIKVCWARDAAAARKLVLERWPTSFIPGEAAQLLPMPRHFEQLAELVTEDMVGKVPCGPDIDEHIKAIQAYVDAGFDEVYIAQIGPHAEDFFTAYRDQVLPALQ